MSKTKIITGRLALSSKVDNGTNIWLLKLDARAKEAPPHILIENGDILKIFQTEARTTVEWEGTVNLNRTKKSVTFTAMTPYGVELSRTVHALSGFPENGLQWTSWFLLNRHASLIKAPKLG